MAVFSLVLRGDLFILVMWEFICFFTFLPNQQTCAFLRLSEHCGHICVTPAAVYWSLTSVGKCERQNISLSTTLSQWDYGMCMSAVCLYVLMAFVKSNLEIVKGLRHSLRRLKKRSLIIWLLFLGIWVILFNSLWSVDLVSFAVTSDFHSLYMNIHLLTRLGLMFLTGTNVPYE